MTSASSLFDFSLNDQRWCKKARFEIATTRTHVQPMHRIWRNFYNPRKRWDQMKKCQWPRHAGSPWMQGGETFHSVPTSCLHWETQGGYQPESQAAGPLPGRYFHLSHGAAIYPSSSCSPFEFLSLGTLGICISRRILGQEVGQA